LIARIVLTLGVAAVLQADSADDVLGRLDTTAKTFKSYSANIKKVDYIKRIDDRYESSGVIRLRKIKNGVAGIIDFSLDRDPQVFHIDGTKLQKYLPKANETQEGDLRKYAATLDQALLLGFGVTRAEILRDYDVKLGGDEKLDAINTTRIVLTPKSAEFLKLAQTIELWIPSGAGYALRMKETAPNGDYQLGTFSTVLLNPPLPQSAFELPAEASHAHKVKLN
jgi:outer membrane lipoprotein-sorting protein